MIEKIERERTFNEGYSEAKSLEMLVQELLDKMDEVIDALNKLEGLS